MVVDPDRIDGVDISPYNLEKANQNIEKNLPPDKQSRLILCDGKSIPVEDESYDVVFSVICFQHICCYDVRLRIFKEVKRVLKPDGYFCFQMGYGNKKSAASYYENIFDAKETNGGHDVSITDEDQLKGDLIDMLKFRNYKSDIRSRGPGDTHPKWIWVQVQK